MSSPLRTHPLLTACGRAAIAVLTALACSAAQPAKAADDLTSLSVEFNDATSLSGFKRVYQVEGWGANQLELLDVNATSPGRLVMMPYTSTWYQDWRGVLMFKNVTGDFVVTTDVEPTRRSGSGAPTADYSLAGIMARTPRGITNALTQWTAGHENYVFLSLGSATSPGVFQYEVKTTVDSASTLIIAPGISRSAIQVARLGSAMIMLRDDGGGNWVVHRRYARPDMPAALQVGLTTYTDWSHANQLAPFAHNQTVITNGTPDLIARFDYLRFCRPQVPSNLVGLVFTDTNQVSDADLLSFLGAHANVAFTNELSVALGLPDAATNLWLSFPTQTGTTYAVEYKPGAADEMWSELMRAAGTGSVVTGSDPAIVSVTGRVYRVREVMADE